MEIQPQIKGYDCKGHNTCINCNCRFPVLDSIMLEVRCHGCQAKFRIERAKRIHDDPAFAEYVKTIQKLSTKGSMFW